MCKRKKEREVKSTLRLREQRALRLRGDAVEQHVDARKTNLRSNVFQRLELEFEARCDVAMCFVGYCSSLEAEALSFAVGCCHLRWFLISVYWVRFFSLGQVSFFLLTSIGVWLRRPLVSDFNILGFGFSFFFFFENPWVCYHL